VETYYIGPDQHVHELAWTSTGGWITQDPTALTGATLAASGTELSTVVDTLDHAVEVYYIGTDQHIHELPFVQGPGWVTPADVTTLTGAINAAVGSPVRAQLDSLESAIEVYFIGSDQHIYEIPFVPGRGWEPAQDLTTLIGAIDAASGSSLSTLVDTQNNAVEVYYIGTDQHIHELTFVPGQGWVAQSDPTALTGAISAASGAAITTQLDTITGAVEIYYVGVDQHVHEIAFVTGQGWVVNQDPTALTGAINAAVGSKLSVHVDPITTAVELYYIGSDQHVHEIAWTGAGGWTITQDATAIAGAPAAAGTTLTGMFDSINNQPEIYYIGSDLHIHELFWASN
jgi:hypothetical protein